jgi:hypothetical protein
MAAAVPDENNNVFNFDSSSDDSDFEEFLEEDIAVTER